MTNYDKFNREERAICSHLFRLLHENLYSKGINPLKLFIGKVTEHNDVVKNLNPGMTNLKYENTRIYCEVAIIRDAFQTKKPFVNPFMDSLTQIIMRQENVNDCRLYSKLPEPLSNPKLTHPKQIRQKAFAIGIPLSESENLVFGSMQGMFNAKPDLVITVDDNLFVFEAKFTEPFDNLQLRRTENITEVWSELLYADFGFKNHPKYSIIKLGASKYNPHISWTEVLSIAELTYPENDRSLIAFKTGVGLLRAKNLE